MSQLFQPFQYKSLHTKNRIVMAPMTRQFSPGGVPTDEVAAYYRRRAEGGVGLILSEGTVINRAASSNSPNVPRFHSPEPLSGWKKVIDGVHEAGGAMAPQIWHMGIVSPHASGWLPSTPFEGPSGFLRPGEVGGIAMTDEDIQDAVRAFAESARNAKELGFDALELHGAHTYLIDQFFWEKTNLRTDRYGGATLAERSRFASEVVRAVRAAVGEDFTVILRVSQWKQQEFAYKLANSPQEIDAWLTPLAEAGVDIFHCSQRRFWEPEFEGSDLNFAGWAKKVTGKPTITVGSVGLDAEFTGRQNATVTPLDELKRRLERGDFDLVAVGRAILADPSWAAKIGGQREAELIGFDKAYLDVLT